MKSSVIIVLFLNTGFPCHIAGSTIPGSIFAAVVGLVMRSATYINSEKVGVLVVVCIISILSIVAALTTSESSTSAIVVLVVVLTAARLVVVVVVLIALHELITIQSATARTMIHWQWLKAHRTINEHAVAPRGLREL